MGLNTSVQGNCDVSDEEGMPFPEEFDILREGFITLKTLIFVICMALDL